jgi:hypothetical protein
MNESSIFIAKDPLARVKMSLRKTFGKTMLCAILGGIVMGRSGDTRPREPWLR